MITPLMKPVLTLPTTLKNGLLCSFPLNEASGTIAYDEHGETGLNGTIIGAPNMNVDGLFDKCIDFVPNDYIITAGSAVWKPSVWSWSFWIYMDSGTNGATRMPGGNGYSSGFAFMWGSNSFFRWGSGTVNQPYVGIISTLFNTWTHFIATYNGTTIKGYRNGIEFLSSTNPFGWHSSNDYGWRIGNSDGTLYTDGKMQQHLMWNRVITAEEMAELNNGGLGKKYSDW